MLRAKGHYELDLSRSVVSHPLPENLHGQASNVGVVGHSPVDFPVGFERFFLFGARDRSNSDSNEARPQLLECGERLPGGLASKSAGLVMH